MNHFAHLIFNTIFVFSKYRKIIFSKKEKIIIVGQVGIGDLCVIGSMIHEYIEKQSKDYKIICAKEKSEVLDKFGINNYIGIPKKDILELRLAYIKNPFFSYAIKKHINNDTLCIADPWFYIKEEYGNKLKGITQYDILAMLAFGIDIPTHPLYPNVEYKNVLHQYNINKPYVIVNMSSNSMKINTNVFDIICQKLLQRGYSVYLNNVEDSECLPGCYGLNCNIDDLFRLANDAELVVSIRSGIIDYIISACKRLFIIYEGDKFYNLFPLKYWNSENSLVEIKGYDNNEILNDFQRFLSEEKL